MSACENQDSTQDALATATKADVVNLKTDVEEALDNYIISTFGVDNTCNIAQSQFNVSLMYIRDRYISSIAIKDNNIFGDYRYTNDKDILQVFDLYVYLCMKYNKHICKYGFECISGISQDTIDRWRTDKKASRDKQDLAKKVCQLDEETLADFLTDGKRNPVGVLAVLNNRHGWSSQRVTHETETPRLDNTEIRGLLGVKS